MSKWAFHLLMYENRHFLKDNLFCLYSHDIIQSHENNGWGFLESKHWLGTNPPTIEELKEDTLKGNFTYVFKLRYFWRTLQWSGSYWYNKISKLKSWIDFHVSQGHSPTTHFITLICAENWRPDLKEYLAFGEDLALSPDADHINHFRFYCKKVRLKNPLCK